LIAFDVRFSAVGSTSAPLLPPVPGGGGVLFLLAAFGESVPSNDAMAQLIRSPSLFSSVTILSIATTAPFSSVLLGPRRAEIKLELAPIVPYWAEVLAVLHPFQLLGTN
jgi:hypothetical protein